MITKDAKYIVFDSGLNDNPIVFPNYLEHDKVAAAFSPQKSTSAGFFYIETDWAKGKQRVVAHGESQSLKLKADVETDSKLLTKMLLQITI